MVLTVTLHEGTHAVVCLLVGGSLMEFSAHHVLCDCAAIWQSKMVSGSASLVNLALGTALWWLSPRLRDRSGNLRFFAWLLMLENWLYGAGYWVFSGMGGIGDWAKVVEGLEPLWLVRAGMAAFGASSYMLLVGLALRELGQFIGGEADEQFGRATRLGLISYAAAAAASLAGGLANPYGLTGLPFVAGMMAALGGLSPLLWMMQWFRAGAFEKAPGPPLALAASWPWRGAGAAAVAAYALILGPTLYF